MPVAFDSIETSPVILTLFRLAWDARAFPSALPILYRDIAHVKRKKRTTQPLDNKQTGLYSLSMERTRPTSEARQRILETADRLFYQEGVRAVGVDRIIAEAGVAKMSLYKHFPSKDDLILAVLKHREVSVLEFFR